jgi:hypothetical protein
MGKLDAVVHLKGTKFFLSQYEMLIGFKTQAFWLSPISSFANTKLLQAPSGHACKGC